MTELEKYIDSKVNDGTDKYIPFEKIPDSIKEFWRQQFENTKLQKDGKSLKTTN